MAHIIFYTKPGCLGGIRQKNLLIQSKHTVEERSSLDRAWTPDTLRPFFGQQPIASWYNLNAPDVKSGKVIPGVLTEKETLELLCYEPLLIKRPLMEIADKKLAGFDIDVLQTLIHLEYIPDENLNVCQKAAANNCTVH